MFLASVFLLLEVPDRSEVMSRWLPIMPTIREPIRGSQQQTELLGGALSVLLTPVAPPNFVPRGRCRCCDPSAGSPPLFLVTYLRATFRLASVSGSKRACRCELFQNDYLQERKSSV